jgi:hypothetical protein
MLIGLLATGIISNVPYISLNVDELRDDLQSLVQPRIQITEIASESEAFDGETYGTADDGKITISFNVSSIDGALPRDDSITFTVGSVNAVTTRGSAVTFEGFNAGTYELSAKDNGLNSTIKAFLVIGYGSEPSYIEYKNAQYVGTGSVHLMPVLCEPLSGAGADITISNIRTGFASIDYNGLTVTPLNKPLTGNYLSQQQFILSGLDSRSHISYAANVADPVTRVTHNLFLSAGYREYKSPSLKINYINSETASANNGSISVTFNSNETLSSNNVTLSLNTGTNTIVQPTTIGTPVVFSNLDSLLVTDNDLTITDQAKNRTWTLKLHIGYQDGLSYIYHNDNILYQTGDTIIFPADQSVNPVQTKILYQNTAYKKGDRITLS